MFLGAAYMSVVCNSWRRLGKSAAQPLKLDAVKMSHHGSKHNITPEFFELVDAEHFLFSSNGDRFKHPNREAVEAVIQGGPQKPTAWVKLSLAFTRGRGSGSQGAGAKD